MNNIVPMNKKQMKHNIITLFIRDLDVAMFVGVYPHEKQEKQRVRINLKCETVVQHQPGDLESVVCYDRLVQGIERHLSHQHIDLVETIAEDICRLCFEDVRVLKVWIRVEKPDIYNHVAGVGVEMERGRE